MTTLCTYYVITASYEMGSGHELEREREIKRISKKVAEERL
jgi:hypothetical protein